MGKNYESNSNGETRKVRSSGDSIRYDKFTSRPGSAKNHDHSGIVIDFVKGVARIFGSGENVGKK